MQYVKYGYLFKADAGLMILSADKFHTALF